MNPQLDTATYDPHRITPRLYIRASNLDDRALAVELAEEGARYYLLSLSDKEATEWEQESPRAQIPTLLAGEGCFPGIKNILWWQKAYGREYRQVNERKMVQTDNILKFQIP